MKLNITVLIIEIITYLLNLSIIEIYVSCDNIEDNKPYNRICVTETCKQDARKLLERMNVSADPCQDFVAYVCGNQKPGELSDYMRTENYDKLQLNYKITPEDPVVTIKAKQLYQNCMTFNSSVNPVKDIMKKLNIWPILGVKWTAKNFTWKNYFKRYARNYLMPDDFFIFAPMVDEYLPFDDIYEFYIETKKSFNYITTRIDQKKEKLHEIFHDILKILGVKDEKKINQSIHEYGKFSHKLYCVTKRRGTKRKLPLLQLMQDIPSVPWLELLEIMLHSVIDIVTDKHSKIESSHFIHYSQIFITVDCMKCLKEIIQLVKETDESTLANYLMWRLLIKAVPYFNEDLRRSMLHLERNFIVSDTPRDKQKYCLYVAKRCWYELAAYDYIERNKLFNVKGPVTKLVRNVQRKAAYLVSQSDWLDEELRNSAVKKIQSMTLSIAYPSFFERKTYLKWFYCPLKNINMTDPDQYWHIIRILNYQDYILFVTKFTGLSEEEWAASIFNDDVSYFIDFNELYFPVPFLQSNIFQEDRPHYMNYATVGFISGHEIFHSIVESNVAISKNGSSNVNFTKTQENYDKKFECFEVQIKRIWKKKFPNFDREIDELICDREGALTAYKAYEHYVINDPNVEEAALSPEFLHLDARKMFWIQLANIWCINNPSSPTVDYSKLSVLLPLVNSKEFSRDWKCKSNDAMNLHEKCSMYVN